MTISIRRSRPLFGAIAMAALLGATATRADEGMWPFHNVPVRILQERYNFTPDPGWLDHLRLSSVRFNDGGSGSFVSPNGLVLTNHHVAAGQIEKLSTPQRNLMRDGFYARTRAGELKCPDLELNVLMSMEEVTARVQKAAAGVSDQAKALEARQAAAAAIEQESLNATGLRSDVVTLYQGGEYWLYRYKKYTDVRLVFAPEQQAAFFGGDPDNFTYPRYALDFALVRAYENGAPIASPHYLKWSANGAAEGDLVFVTGHPGSTDRLNTVAQLETDRDLFYPISIDVVKRRLEVLRKYAAAGEEQRRQAAGIMFSLENALKAYRGEYAGLLDERLMAKKRQDEADFRKLVESRPEWKAAYGAAWPAIEMAEQREREMFKPNRFRQLRGSSLAGLAVTLVQYVAETKKPDSERLEGFHAAQLPSLELALFSPRPFYPALEETLLGDSLQESREQLGDDDPFIRELLGARSAAEVAKHAIQNTKLADPAFRKELAAGGLDAVSSSADPLIAVARIADRHVREMHDWMEKNVESAQVAAGEQIATARFEAYGRTRYPDATFTLRLSFGTVKGYPMNGTQAPPLTTYFGLYDRANGFGLKPPYNLPARYVQRKPALDLSTPLNFVSTNDIIGGNSGSPVVNRAGELVGLVFDGNIESLVGRFVYSDEANRSIAVHSAGIIQALRKLYDAGPLADELAGRRPKVG